MLDAERKVATPEQLAKWPEKRLRHPGVRIAYGYKVKPGDEYTAVPDPYLIAYIEEALDAIDGGTSLREAAAWLSEITGVPISHQGVNNIWKRMRGSDPKNAREKKQKKIRRENAPKTPQEKARARVKRKISDAKRIQTLSKKKLAHYAEKNRTPSTEEQDSASVETYSAASKPDSRLSAPSITENLDFEALPTGEPEVIFRPNPGPQTEFLAAGEREVLYGGAAGGGKSFGLLADPMRYFDNPNFNGLILRRTNDELRELIWKSQDLYPKAFPGARWQEKKSQWTFPSGARMWFTYLERDEDVLRYQGQAFSYIAFDELTQHPTPFAWDFMRSRLRTTDPTLPIYMRATTNPGGPGHGWVKATFIDPAPPNVPFTARSYETGEPMVYPEGHAKAGQPLFQRRFIPASLYDNPYLADDGAYEANLFSLPENQRRQLLEGDWAVADGAAFPEFRPRHHVVEPFEIPETWRRFRSCDFGYSSHSAVHWYAIDPAYETLVVYRELYVSKHTGRDLAKLVLQTERGERIDYGVLDSSAWHVRGQVGPSIAEEMIAEGCRWRPSDRSAGARVAGKNRLHELLKVDEDTGMPGICFFDTCRQIIADLPVIPQDPKGGDDIDSRFRSDHAYDSIRYGIMSRPRAFSPFDTGQGVPIQQWRPADTVLGY